MKQAETINQFARNMNPIAPLDAADRQAYVPIYDHILADLRDRVLYEDQVTQTFFIAGQSGTGKTTALNFLVDDELNEHFAVRFIRGKDLFDPSDIDIIDLLLMLAFCLVRGSSLEEHYYKSLNRIQKIHDGVLSEETLSEHHSLNKIGGSGEASAAIGFFDFVKLKSRFFANYQQDQHRRVKTREAFKLRKNELLDMVNDLIDRVRGEEVGNKPLLMVIDDLDKLRNIKQIRSVFLENRYFLTNIQCTKIIAIPIHLTNEPEITNLDPNVPNFGLALKPNPLYNKSGSQDLHARRQLLRNVVLQRIQEGCALIENDALDEAITFSGGLIRQFMLIVHTAARQARRNKQETVIKENVAYACQQLANNLERWAVTSARIQCLETIRRHHIPQAGSSDEWTEALLGNHIIAFTNGSFWYSVNPLIEKTIEIYAGRVQQNESEAFCQALC